MRIQIISLFVIATSLGCASTAPKKEAAGAEASIADSDLGLSKTSVFDTPVPDAVEHMETDPSDAKPIARSWPGEPPLIPHAIADMLPLKPGDNMCLDCHADGDAKPLSDEHFTDLRNAPDKKTKEVVGARFVCISCHVAPTGAKPLVSNQF